MDFLYIKALHITFVVTWFAGLFYIVRLFIYHVEAQERDEHAKKILSDQFKIMEKRLWYGITWPSAILTLIFGSILASHFTPFKAHTWLHIKLLFVAGLYIYHHLCGSIFKQLQRNQFKYTSNQLRIWNEVATLFLIAIVFLVVLKNILHMGYALIGLIIFSVLLMVGIKFYKSLREKKA